jgi:lipopolysaccharide/colanic/teichoic acid biosynthesis glycosyltransferase
VEDFRSPVVDRALDRVGRALLARADRVVAVGETMRDRLVEDKGAEPTRVAVIHNWADCAALTPRPKDNPFAREHGLAEPFVVMHSGNVGLSQNLDTFVDAAARLREERGLVWVIMGDGARRVPLQARVRALGLEGQVRFLASQPAERLADAFGSADAFVIGLRQGLAGCIVPSKLYGILAAGRPYIAAVEPACEVASVTFKHDCGLLAPPGDSAVLAARVLELYRDRPLARHLGANARRASESFDRPAQVDAYARVLREAASEPRPVGDWRLKRAFDVALSGLGLLVSTPLWALIAVCIKAEDGGPVFFGQERVGRGGRLFRSLKFRSMVADAERFGPIQAIQGDRRVTRVGQWLRASAMDELPQLWNIFTGDMSFVGPRALVPAEVETGAGGVLGRLEDVPGYARRHRVRPGLTGIAQVFAARDVPRRCKFRYDLLYISRRSFWLDLKLIALSFWITGLGRWEKRGPKL